MGQEEVKKELKKSGSWLLSNEIAKATGQSLKSIQSSLRRLVKWGEVKKEPASRVIQDSNRLKEKSFAGYAYKIKDFKTIDDFKFKDKTVLLRLDLDSQMHPSFISTDHFSHHLPTILELLEKQAKIVILTHQASKSNDGKNPTPLLDMHASYLSQKLNKEVRYIDDLTGETAQNSIKSLTPGDIIILKNLFSEKEEMKTKFKKQKKTKLVKTLSHLADYYVNDSFSLAHLSYTSLTGFPQVMPSCIGRFFEKEIEAANHLLDPVKPCLYILGGDKPLELAPFIKASLEKNRVNTILTSGFLSHLLHLAQGKKLGGQEEELKKLKIKVSSDIKKIAKYENVILPKDYKASTLGVAEKISLHHFPIYQSLYEIGSETVEDYLGLIKNAKTIVIKGPLGKIEDNNFQEATKAVLEEIEKSNAFTYIVGNSTVDCFKQFNIPIKNIKHLSKNTQPLLTYLTEEKLPTVEVLRTK
ncbi:phosphoglycerate kinase [Candidatus Woesearchaeota archaeon]|nr:phosphoglycerate kinase [Candidatus Woesearchaeota archaeon]